MVTSGLNRLVVVVIRLPLRLSVQRTIRRCQVGSILLYRLWRVVAMGVAIYGVLRYRKIGPLGRMTQPPKREKARSCEIWASERVRVMIRGAEEARLAGLERPANNTELCILWGDKRVGMRGEQYSV